MTERLLPRIEPPIKPEEVKEDDSVEREVNGVKYKIIYVKNLVKEEDEQKI